MEKRKSESQSTLEEHTQKKKRIKYVPAQNNKNLPMAADYRDYTVTDTDCVIRVVATKPSICKKPDAAYGNTQFEFRMTVNNYEGKTYNSSGGSFSQTFKGQVAKKDKRTAAQKNRLLHPQWGP